MTTKEQERISTVEQGLTLLAGSLALATRDDGSEYRMLIPGCPMREQLEEVVRACHMGELPNDWHYETIYGLCHGLLDYSQPDTEPWSAESFEEVVEEVADSLADVYTSSLLDWLAEKPDRCTFYDVDLPDAYGHKGIDGLARILETLLAQEARHRQADEIAAMGRELLHQLDTLAKA